MPILTTKLLGKTDSDPKPVTGVNYAGEPMKPGDFYNGRPEHMAPSTAKADPLRPGKRVISPAYRVRLLENMAKARAAAKARKAQQAQG